MNDVKSLVLNSQFKFILINYNKVYKLNLEIYISTTKSKNKLYSLNKNVKFLDLKFAYPNEAL